MRIYCAARFSGEHRAHNIANRDDLCALLAGLAFGGEGVRCFSRLADRDDQAVVAHDGIAIAKFTAVIYFDWKTEEALDHELSGKASVPAGAAGDDLYVLEGAEFFLGEIHFI